MGRITRKASIAEAKGRLSVLVNMVAHGHERVVLTSRGHPKAAIVGLDDLAALEDISYIPVADDSPLTEADLLRERILQRRHGAVLADSVADLNMIREEASNG